MTQLPSTQDGHAELFREAALLGTATLHEAAGRMGVVDPAVATMTPGLKTIGPAFPVSTPPGDNLWLHRALYAAQPGDVLVVSTGGGYEFGYWGEVLSHAAAARGIAGVVIDGCVRDAADLLGIGVPVFARGLCFRGTVKDPNGKGSLGEPIRLGDVEVNHGDFILGDADGVFCLPMQRLPEVVTEGRNRRDHEQLIIAQLHSGATTLDLYGLPAATDTPVWEDLTVVGKRRTFELAGLDHGSTPIPLASQVGTLFRTGGIMGKDPATGTLSPDGPTQVAQAFANVEALLKVAGLGMDRVVFVEVLLADDSLRGEVNTQWLARFPDPADRPARHATTRPLPGGFLVQLLVEAVAEDE